MSRRGPKPKPESEKRKHPVTCRLTDIEAVKVDERRGQMTRGEWIRTAALKRPPKIIPTVNREAWLALSKLAGNLNQIAKAVNQGLVSDIGRDEIISIRSQVEKLRLELIGVTHESTCK